MKGFLPVAILAALCLVEAQARSKDDLKCGKCDVESCVKLATTECLSGIVKDECGCCRKCAQMEGEPCDRSQDPNGYGPCGDGLECTSTEFGSFCLCQHKEIICGSDGVTYSNLCQLMAAAVRSQRTKTLKVDYRGPCDPAAKIMTPPEFTRNYTGGSVVLSCEAVGFPTPHMAWIYTRADNQTYSMPGDDEKILTASRGGPARFQVTGWIQIEKVEKHHEGDYTCVAQNKHNKDFAKARVKVLRVEDDTDE
ncbi:insulin-like growth factor-binding protein-related protein 1 [Gigantopelta aegis]|uniref:insulin-like growth factor-binding protein-related protein 1 n=1 Tax=Gigantopelta aegis TaxID=1735272 RepID=UPI001B8878C3|nr:insulin-like growth factor-binding protein-related protein 1 [Gigantopelta aegis]